MTVPYVGTGRVSQKARTQEALIDAARRLLAGGESPTMEAVAAAAAVSRTTAYRYFPNVRALLVAAYPHAEADSILGPDPPADAAGRLRLLVADHAERILRHEREMRAVLRLSLDPGGTAEPQLPMHRGLRIEWIEEALEPLSRKLEEPELRTLVHGIGATMGIEAYVWLTDIAGLSREEAARMICLNAERLLRAALEEAGAGSS